ncbi:MAG: hypothetical protein VR64_02215 [Desulfatitalea sp. BRH_c12]|nr:MAG: hypothetical protein VR64_02215 [Desulfatitalea sp. BRH_c12]
MKRQPIVKPMLTRGRSVQAIRHVLLRLGLPASKGFQAIFEFCELSDNEGKGAELLNGRY